VKQTVKAFGGKKHITPCIGSLNRNETNCEGIWRQETHYALYWQFEQERDAMLFMLRWGSAEGNSVK